MTVEFDSVDINWDRLGGMFTGNPPSPQDWKKILFKCVSDLYRRDLQKLVFDKAYEHQNPRMKSEDVDWSNTKHKGRFISRELYVNGDNATRWGRNDGTLMKWEVLFSAFSRFLIQSDHLGHKKEYFPKPNDAFLEGFAQAIAKWSGVNEVDGFSLETPESTLCLFLMMKNPLCLFRLATIDDDLKMNALQEHERIEIEDFVNSIQLGIKVKYPSTQFEVTPKLLIAYCKKWLRYTCGILIVYRDSLLHWWEDAIEGEDF